MEEDSLVLSMFQEEFKRMHSDLVEKEAQLFARIFERLFSTRMAKLEQFMQHKYPDFECFEVSSNVRDEEQSSPCHGPVFIIKEEEHENVEVFEQEHNLDPLGEERAAPRLKTLIYSETEEEMGQSDDQRTDERLDILEPTSVPNPVRNGNGSGRRRNPIWNCYNTKYSPGGQVLSNECRRCGRPVSVHVTRMQRHTEKCHQNPNAGIVPKVLKLQQRYRARRQGLIRSKFMQFHETGNLINTNSRTRNSQHQLGPSSSSSMLNDQREIGGGSRASGLQSIMSLVSSLPEPVEGSHQSTQSQHHIRPDSNS